MERYWAGVRIGHPEDPARGDRGGAVCSFQSFGWSGAQSVARCLMILVVGKTPSDYLQRVEPSPSGGAKMAQALMGAALGEEEEFF